MRRACRRVGSELLEVALDLPVADLGAVLVPLGPLGLDEVVEDVVAEGFPDDLVPLQLVERVAERARQLPTGSPSSRPFSTPSRPAAIIAAKARYVFEDGSGQRTSTRVPSMDLPGETIGTRMRAERFVRPQVRYVGAS